MIQNISFQGCMPVKFFAKHPKKDVYVPVLKEENIRKCQRFVIQNLNGTAKNNSNPEFVKLYKSVDTDYAANPIARSMYDKRNPLVHLITGYNVYDYEKLGKNLGMVKRDVREANGSMTSSIISKARDTFYSEAQHYVEKICKKVKNKLGEELTLNVFFIPKYNKKGELKGFEYADVLIQSESANKIF